VKVVLCLCKCCFWCLEKFMKFINRSISPRHSHRCPGMPTS
jgi:hypothetical protein